MPWQIFAHEWAADLLRRRLAQGDVRHAYLFTGPRGVGRRTLALQLAQAVNCTEPPEPGVPCGSCRSCTLFARQEHPDLTVVRPEEDSQSLKVEQIRAALHSLTLAPYQARYRIAVLPDFQRATAAAQNALLKTLEEAPERALLLLTADSADNLLPTIVSRCEVLRLRPASVERLAESLHTRWSLDSNEASSLAHLAGGRPGEALRLHEDPAMLQDLSAWLAAWGELLGMPLRERLDWVEKSFKRPERERLHAALSAWLAAWRDIMLLAAGSSAPLTYVDQAHDFQRLVDANLVSLDEAMRLTAAIEEAIHRLDANVNARLLLENVLLDWPRLPLELNPHSAGNLDEFAGED